MVLPLTDSSDESSIDQTPITTNVVGSSTPRSVLSNDVNNTNTSTINTTMSFEEDGSVVVDLTEENESVRKGPTTSRAIFNENDIIPSQNTTTTNGSSSSSSYPPKRTRNQRWLTVVLGMGTLLCFACGICFFLRSKRNVSSSSNSSINSENATPITLEELSLHDDTIDDCWILIDSVVYNVTQYAPTHPGGAEYVTDFCGSNATKDYYIHHPVAYLKTYLSSNSRVGALSESSTIDTTTDDNTKEEEDIKDDSGNENEEDKDNKDEEKEQDPNDESTGVPTSAPNAATTDDSTDAPTSPPVPDCISTDEVMLHSSITDCYYILYDFVYDFTDYIDEHPGGARKVFQECGTDATAVYITEKEHNEDLLLWVNAIELYGLGYAC